MKRLLLFILVLLTGCTQLLPWEGTFPPQKSLLSVEHKMFGQAVDQLSSTQSLTGLREFQQRYPKSPWSARAATVVLYVEELNQRKLQLAESLNTQHQLQTDNQQLQTENQMLNEKIEQLKILLIDLEQRPQ